MYRKMNKKKTKSVAALLSLSAMIALAACSGGGNNNAGSSPASGASSSASAPEKKYEIAWHGNFQLDNMEDNSYVQQIIEKKLNVDINLVNAKMDKINLLAASGDLPDVIRIADPKDVAALASSGVLLELPQDLLKQQMPDVVAAVDEIDPGLWGLSKSEGKNYAIPQYLTVVPYDNLIAWRQDVLDAADVSGLPATIDEYDSAFKAIKSKEKEILSQTKADASKMYMFGGADIQYAWNAFSWVFGAYGSMPGSWQLNDEGKVVHGDTLPGTKEALLKLSEWYKAGYLDPAFVTDKGDQLAAKFNQGGYALTTKGLDQATSPNPDDLQKINPNVIYTYAKSPAGPSGQSGVWAWGNRQNFVGISAKLKDDPEKVNKILQILNAVATDDELYRTTHWGEEGKSYKLENGVPVIIPPYDNDKTPEVAALGTGALGAMGGMFGPFGTNDLVNKYTDPKLVEASQKYYAGKPDVIYMSPLPSTASTEQRILDKWNETFIKIVIGESPISAYDDYLKWFESNGGTKLTEEANALYEMNFKK